MLILKRFDRSDVGKYTCQGANGIGKPISTTIELKKAGWTDKFIFFFLRFLKIL